MGLSNSEDTLMPLLQKANITNNRIFALCYRTGGGIITLGGVDQRLHASSVLGVYSYLICNIYIFILVYVGLQYVKLARLSNWYTLQLLDVKLEDQVTGVQTSFAKLPMGAAIFNMGKGIIYTYNI